MDGLEWLPWGRTRTTQRGVETAFHHPLVAIRLKGDAQVRVVNPGETASWPKKTEIESWRPMAWADAGRRGWQTLGILGPLSAFRGASGHRFHTINSVCEQLFEGDVLGAEGVRQWHALLGRRVEWCAARNIIYRHLVIPEHHSVYADMIPDAPSLSMQRPLHLIMGGLAPHVRETIVYPLQQMIDGRARDDTSLRHDVHFTGYGAFLCYQALVRTLAAIDISEVVREEDLREREIFVAGDVSHALDEPGQRVRTHEPPRVKQKGIIKGTSFRTNQVDVYESESSSGRRLVMFRTSNSTALIPYLLHHFSRITAVATTRVFYDLIVSEQPDVVIAEMPERYLAANKVSADTNVYASTPDDEGHFEAETGYALPLPRG